MANGFNKFDKKGPLTNKNAKEPSPPAKVKALSISSQRRFLPFDSPESRR